MTRVHTENGTTRDAPFLSFAFLGTCRAGVCFCADKTSTMPKDRHLGRVPTSIAGLGLTPNPTTPYCDYMFTGCSAVQASTMILPQVHLRKPCYDFSFL